MPAVVITNQRSSMPTDVVHRADPAFLIANDQDGVRIDIEREIIARIRNFTGMSREQPSSAPDGVEIVTINLGVRIKSARNKL